MLGESFTDTHVCIPVQYCILSVKKSIGSTDTSCNSPPPPGIFKHEVYTGAIKSALGAPLENYVRRTDRQINFVSVPPPSFPDRYIYKETERERERRFRNLGIVPFVCRVSCSCLLLLPLIAEKVPLLKVSKSVCSLVDK